MPRASKVRAPTGPPESTFVLDNGAYTLKAGFATSEVTENEVDAPICKLIPNCLVRTRDRKTYIGAQCDEIIQWSEAVYRRPIENGQLVGWEAQKEIWDFSFFDEKTAQKDLYIRDPKSTTLIYTESSNSLPALQKNADEIIMEEWEFGGYMRTVGATLNAYNDLHSLYETDAAMKADPAMLESPMECLLVIDCGYSHTTITPLYQGRPIQRAIRRLEIGGKHLTNLLKEMISIRHFDLHQDTKTVSDIKEDVSFISQDFEKDMEKAWKGNKDRARPVKANHNEAMDIDGQTYEQDIRVDYILPDGIHVLRGFSRPHDPSAAAARKRKLNALSADASEISMTLGNERFSIPEVIFNPSDIGSKQPGLADCVLQALSVLPPLLQATMLANVLVVGGTTLMSGFVERLESELRSRTSSEWPVRVRATKDPITSTWTGGARLATKYFGTVKEYATTREEYLEHGSAWMARKFANGSVADT